MECTTRCGVTIFFFKEKNSWINLPDAQKRDLLEKKEGLDANYAKNEWAASVLETKATAKAKPRPKPGEEKKITDDVFPYADGSDWRAPLDPFDTVRDDHRPAPHYIRVYCQKGHYSLGWRMMNILHELFKSGTEANEAEK